MTKTDPLQQEISRNLMGKLKTVLAEDRTNAAAANMEDMGTVIDSYAGYYHLLEKLAPQIEKTGFYLKLGQSYEIHDLGLLGYAMVSAANLKESWDMAISDQPMLGHPCYAERLIIEGRLHVKLIPPKQTYNKGICFIEEWLSGTWQWVCTRLPQYKYSTDMAVQLAYPEPDYQGLYEDCFPGSITFNAAFTSLSFPVNWYYLPLSGANPAVFEITQKQCQKVLQKMTPQDHLVVQVREHLLRSAHLGFLSLTEMANSMNMAKHTLHRRLKAAGQSYKDILLEIRMQLASQYLAETKLTIKEICYLVGYEHSPSFCRAYKKYYGVSPEANR